MPERLCNSLSKPTRSRQWNLPDVLLAIPTEKETDSNITEEALAMLESDPENRNKKTTVLYQEHWHKGVVGIVASRLTKPITVLQLC